MTAHAQFEAHLDACERCRTQPFNLCEIGAPILQRAATEAADALTKARTDDLRDNDRHPARPL